MTLCGPSVPQSHTDISEQWGARGWFPKILLSSWYQQPANPKMSYLASLPPSQSASERVPRALPLSEPMYIYDFPYWSSLQNPTVFQAPAARRGQNPGWVSLQVKIPVPWILQGFWQCKKSKFPNRCGHHWAAHGIFPFLSPFWTVGLIKYCSRSWYSGMALKDERKIFISFFCLWIRMFYLKKVPSAGLLMSYYPLWK